jgi:hypothetical protein
VSGEVWIVDLISFLGMRCGIRMDVSIGRKVQLVSHGTNLMLEKGQKNVEKASYSCTWTKIVVYKVADGGKPNLPHEIPFLYDSYLPGPSFDSELAANVP